MEVVADAANVDAAVTAVSAGRIAYENISEDLRTKVGPKWTNGHVVFFFASANLVIIGAIIPKIP
jgi:hypothetical protein